MTFISFISQIATINIIWNGETMTVGMGIFRSVECDIYHMMTRRYSLITIRVKQIWAYLSRKWIGSLVGKKWWWEKIGRWTFPVTIVHVVQKTGYCQSQGNAYVSGDSLSNSQSVLSLSEGMKSKCEGMGYSIVFNRIEFKVLFLINSNSNLKFKSFKIEIKFKSNFL